MPRLLVEFQNQQREARFARRVLIGRKEGSGIVLDDDAVSRIHAWIDASAGGYYLADARSRTGTFVNNQRVRERIVLHDGDSISIGPARLKFSTDAPTDEDTDIASTGGASQHEDEGILFTCLCGAPIWVPGAMAGTRGKCRYCGSPVDVPGITTPSAEPAPPPADAPVCNVCHTALGAADDATTCPTCGLLFHTECWTENRGCSAYGCAQANVLDPNRPTRLTPEEAQAHQEEAEHEEIAAIEAMESQQKRQWSLVLPLAAAILSILGLVSFGATAILGALAMAVFGRRYAPPLAIWASVALCVLGAAAGVVVSRFWWFNAPLLFWRHA